MRRCCSRASIAGINLLRLWADVPDAVGIVTFTVDGYEAGEVAAFLSAEHGIGVRDGRFCAHPLLSRLGLSGGAVRASLGLGSSSDDVTRLINAVSILVSNQRDWNYEKTAGAWNPVPETRTFLGGADNNAGATECV